MADAQVDEGAGTFKFIKIKKFIRGNSEWRRVYSSAGFSYLRGEETGNWDGDGSRGRREKEGKKIAVEVRFPCSAHPPETGRKGIIIISRGLGLLKRKQTPLPGKNRLGWNVLPSR